MLLREDITDAPAVNDINSLTIPDVRRAFAAVNPIGDRLAAWDGGHIPSMRYTTEPENNGGMLNHFQGLLRLSADQVGHAGTFVLSGGDWTAGGGSHVFVIQMESADTWGPITSNLVHADNPPDDDVIVQAVRVDDELWHAGGMDAVGPILAIPVEHMQLGAAARFATGANRTGTQQSKIYFVNMSQPESPAFFPGFIERPITKAGAVALTRLPNGHFLCGVWSDDDADKERFPKRLELYLSENPSFDGHFRQEEDQIQTWAPVDDDNAQWAGSFQTVNFVWDDLQQLYMLGFHEARGHHVQLYQLNVDSMAGPPATNEGVSGVTITRIAHKNFACPTDYCDMKGASGAYVENGELYLYSGAQFRQLEGDSSLIRFTEFRPPIQPYSDEVDEPNEGWIELYTSTEFTGESLLIRDITGGNADFSDYDDVKVGGKSFGNQVHSLRYQLPSGTRYELYNEKDYGQLLLTLDGSTDLVELPDLENTVAGKISSSRIVAGPTR